jgi:hypothetical protein
VLDDFNVGKKKKNLPPGKFRAASTKLLIEAGLVSRCHQIQNYCLFTILIFRKITSGL